MPISAIRGNVVAAADVSGGSAFAVQVADVQTVHRSGALVGEDARAVDHLRQLRMRQRHLDHDDGIKRGVGVVDAAARASRQLLSRANRRVARHIQVDIVLIVRIRHQRVRVRSTASLHARKLLRMQNVADVEDAHAAEALLARRLRRTYRTSTTRTRPPGAPSAASSRRRRTRRGRRRNIARRQRNPFHAAIHTRARRLYRQEQQIAIHRRVALRALAQHRRHQLRLQRIRRVIDVEAVIVANDHVLALERQVRVGRAPAPAREAAAVARREQAPETEG